jgi:MFS family permease
LSSRTSAPAHVERGTPAFRKINLAVFAAGYSTFLLMYAVQPLLPIFTEEFHISAAASSLALSLTTGCLAVSMLVVGAVAEGWSRKPVMSVSLMAVAILTLLSSMVSAWPAFLLIRAIEGIALAGLPALAMAYVGEEIHPDAIGVSMGLYVGSGALGGMTGRLLTGVLADLFSWRPALAVIGVVGIAASILFSSSLPPSLIGMLSHRFSRPRLLQAGLATMLAGVAITAARPLAAVITGVALVTIGFFAAQSVASSWVGIRAREAKAQASSLYLFFYYMGASIAGSFGGFFWTAFGWTGVAGFLVGLLLVALGIAITSLKTEGR